MKKLFSALFLFTTLFSSVFAQKDVPYLTGRINDVASVLSSSTVESLESELRAHEDSTSNQIAVLIIPSLDGEILEEYSLKVAETWKLGQKDKDNGVLLLVAINDRKMRIEVGYGLEGDLTDALSSRIIRNEIAPSFRQEDYNAGITNGVHAIMAAISGSYVMSEEEYAYEGDDMADIPWYMRLVAGSIFLIVIGMFTFFAFMSQGCASWFLFVFLLPFYLTFPFFIFGTVIAGVLILTYFFGFLYFKLFYIKSGTGKKWFETTSKKWISTSGSSSGSGWSSGGGFSSGGSSFSGGGGSFGGGGSSGSW